MKNLKREKRIIRTFELLYTRAGVLLLLILCTYKVYSLIHTSFFNIGV